MRSTSPTLAVLPLLLSPLAAQNCVDQSYLPSPYTNGLEITANQPVTQTFTCGRSGQLTRVQLAAITHHTGITTNDLTIDIVTTDAQGVPTTTSLAQVVIPPGSVPTSIGVLDIPLANFGIQVQAGDVLGIACTSPNGPGSAPSYAWWGEAPATTYGDGQVFISGTTSLSVWDLAFQTFVDDVASFANYGSGHPGSVGVPALGSSAPPVLGTTPDVLVGNSAAAPTLGVLFAGTAQLSAPTPFGGTALLQPLVGITVTFATSGAEAVAFPIPSDPLLCGFDVYLQAIVLDAGASADVAFTPGLAYHLGL